MIETSTAVCDCANHAHVHLTDMVIGKPYDVEDDSRPAALKQRLCDR